MLLKPMIVIAETAKYFNKATIRYKYEYIETR